MDALERAILVVAAVPPQTIVTPPYLFLILPRTANETRPAEVEIPPANTHPLVHEPLTVARGENVDPTRTTFPQQEIILVQLIIPRYPTTPRLVVDPQSPALLLPE